MPHHLLRLCRPSFLRLASLAIISVIPLSATANDLSLADGGKTGYAIALSKNAIPAERTAAAELQKYLKEVTGAELSIIDQSQASANGPFIYIGSSDTVRQLLTDVPWDTLQPDDIVIKTKGNALFLAGGRPRGTLYATYQFLEDVVGCEWWTPKVSTIPHVKQLKVPAQDLVYSPPTAYRFAYYPDFFGNPAFGAKMKQNGVGGAPDELGGVLSVIGGCHTFAKFLPPDKYFEAHPEWGALVNGKRQRWTETGGQLCLSNREVIAAMVKAANEQLDANPGQHVISISTNDNYFRCECDQCQALEKKENAASGPLIYFVNAVAREVKKTHPDALIHTLAYIYTFKAPLNIKPEDNVLIAVCTFTGNLFLPYTDKGNAFLTKDVKQWTAISKHMFFWDYTGDYDDSWRIRPNIFIMAQNLRYFMQFKPWGMFSQGVSYFEPVTDFQGLRMWITTHLQWNPNADETALIKRFLQGYYTAASAPLFDYLKFTDDEARKIGDQIVLQGNGEATLPFPASYFKQASAYFDQAEEAVKDKPELLKRVQLERLALAYTKLNCYVKARATGRADEIFPTPEEAAKACDSFLAQVKALGVDPQRPAHYSGGNTNGVVSILKRLIKSPIQPLPPIAQGKNVVDYLAPNLYWNGTKWEISVDRKADGMVVLKIPANSPQTQGTLGPEITPKMEGKKWTSYAMLKYQGEQDGSAEVGIFDRDISLPKVKKIVPLKNGTGYTAIAIGSGHLKAVRDLIYVKPVQDSDSDSKGTLFLQRIFLVEEQD